VILENPWGRVEVLAQGAQVISYVPAGGPELLWVSPRAHRDGRPLRGGIPLCVPWFASPYPGKGSHGFGRTRRWTAGEPSTRADGTHLIFRLEDDAETRTLWPVSFLFEHEVVLGPRLLLIFRAWNRGADPAPFELVWHSYFTTPDSAEVHVEGLEGCVFSDRNQPGSRGVAGPILRCSGPVDLVFPQVPPTQRVTGAPLSTVESDAPGAVVWNPGDADARSPDLGPGTHRQFFCLERGSLGASSVLVPGVPFERRLTITGPSVDFSSHEG